MVRIEETNQKRCLEIFKGSASYGHLSAVTHFQSSYTLRFLSSIVYWLNKPTMLTTVLPIPNIILKRIFDAIRVTIPRLTLNYVFEASYEGVWL